MACYSRRFVPPGSNSCRSAVTTWSWKSNSTATRMSCAISTATRPPAPRSSRRTAGGSWPRRRCRDSDSGVGFAQGAFIGLWILQPPNGPDQPVVAGQADLGFRLMRRHWRRGYAGEGARELIRYGFGDVGLDRIFAQTMAVNAASRATMRAAGLSFVRAFLSGEPYDDPIPEADQGEVEYDITRTGWEQPLNTSGQTHSPR